MQILRRKGFNIGGHYEYADRVEVSSDAEEALSDYIDLLDQMSFSDSFKNSDYNTSVRTADLANHAIYEFSKRFKNGSALKLRDIIDGIIFYGYSDGPVCVVYHPERLRTYKLTGAGYFNDEGSPVIETMIEKLIGRSGPDLIDSFDLAQELDDDAKEELNKVPSMNGLELASRVSTKEPYYFGKKDAKYKIAVLDLGVKKNILKNLAKRNAYMKVFPHDSSFEDMKSWNPDAYFISNGPGDPEPLTNAINVTKKILESNKPLFGICLGHQVIALANGIKTYKMHNGHRGINHPVINLKSGKGEITSQNHGFAIDKDDTSKNKNIEITHMHLNDDTIAGIKIKNKKCFSVQYHPEASAGPHDSSYLFDEFIELIKN